MKAVTLKALACAMALLAPFPLTAARAQSADRITEQTAYEIGVDAYIYFYPLIMMDVTRLQLTNIEAGKLPGRGPMNAFAHLRAYPTAEFREVVRPNRAGHAPREARTAISAPI